MNRFFGLSSVAGILVLTNVAYADTPWSTRNYELHAGDFNGDGLSDVLYIARDARHLSGIALSDKTGFNNPLQTWNNAYLGIPWSNGEYEITVADFNGAGRDDLFLQRRSPGDHYLLLTTEQGVSGISQAIPNDAMGISWSQDAHRIVAGDFNGDKRADLFLQAMQSSGLNAVVLADGNGQFTASVPHQSWRDGYAGFAWSATKAIASAGDFNGDGRSDLLLQARPIAGTGTGGTPAAFTPISNGVLLAGEGKTLFATERVQAWDEEGFGANWSPLRSAVLVGDFNGDDRKDVILQGLQGTDPTFLLYGRSVGPIFERAATFDAETMPTPDQQSVLVGRFFDAKVDGLYFQARDFAQSNFVASVGRTGIAVDVLRTTSCAS